MDDEQAIRIALAAFAAGALPYLPALFRKLLGNCERSKSSAMFAIGKAAGTTLRRLIPTNKRTAQ